MKEYLTFNSIGGGSLEVATAGEYVIQLESIIAVDGGGYSTGTKLAIWSTTPADSVTACSYYEFEFSGSKSAVQEAFLKAIEAKPGGRGAHVLLPLGTSITSWSFANEGVY
jgi:hypothetical protein|tara:strand:+ start:1851 stop:2183 length:333 start_codon:yes stop_codon:yes gene_type:complete